MKDNKLSLTSGASSSVSSPRALSSPPLRRMWWGFLNCPAWVLLLFAALSQCFFLLNGTSLHFSVTVLEVPAVKLSPLGSSTWISAVANHVLGVGGVTLLDSRALLETLRPDFTAQEYKFLEGEMGKLSFHSLFLAYGNQRWTMLDALKEQLTRKCFIPHGTLASLQKVTIPQVSSGWESPYKEVAETFQRDKREGKFLLGEYVLYINGTFAIKSFNVGDLAPKMRGRYIYMRKVTEEDEIAQVYSVNSDPFCPDGTDMGGTGCEKNSLLVLPDNPPLSESGKKFNISDNGPAAKRSIWLKNPNDHKKARVFDFTIDTGAMRTTVSPSLVDALDLEPTSEMHVTLADGTTKLVPTYHLLLLIKDQPIHLFNAPLAGGSPLLGTDVLSIYNLTASSPPWKKIKIH